TVFVEDSDSAWPLKANFGFNSGRAVRQKSWAYCFEYLGELEKMGAPNWSHTFVTPGTRSGRFDDRLSKVKGRVRAARMMTRAALLCGTDGVAGLRHLRAQNQSSPSRGFQCSRVPGGR